MYLLSKLCMRIALLAAFYSLAVVALSLPAVGAGLALMVIVGLGKRRQVRLTTLGSAQWAEEAELRRAGMVGARSGLCVGRLPPRRPGLDWWEKRDHSVRLAQAVHTAIFSPTGGGKGVSFVIPFLLECPDSCVVIDPKGENAKLTAKRRRRLGHQVALLDPFQVASETPDSFNPLDYIQKNSPAALDECRALAQALVVRTGQEKEPHWNDSAEAWIAAVIALVVFYGEAGQRSLQTVRQILSDPAALEEAVKVIGESDAWGGMLARMGGQLKHYVDKERSSVLTTVNRHLRFLDTLAVARSTESSSFDPAALRAGRMTVYLILPPEHLRSQSPLLRMWIGSLLHAVVRGGLQEARKVHFLLDESASLGHLEPIDDALDKYRGYGVRLLFFFQSLGQLGKCFPDGQEQTLLSNVSQVYFAVNDTDTAQKVSDRLGEATILVTSGGTNEGTNCSWASDASVKENRGRSSGSSSNWQQQARRLLKPEEVIALPPRTAITFTPGVPPIRTTLSRWYEEKRPGRLRRAWRGCSTLITSAGVGLLAVALAAELSTQSSTFEKENDHVESGQEAVRGVEGDGAREGAGTEGLRPRSQGGALAPGRARLDGAGQRPVQRERVRPVRSGTATGGSGARDRGPVRRGGREQSGGEPTGGS